MDITLVLTAAAIIFTVIGSNIALMAWLRSDIKSFEVEIRGWKEDFRRDMSSYKDEIQKEMKDFHGRLCSLESRWHSDNFKQKTDP